MPENNMFDPYEVLQKLPAEAQRLLLKILSHNNPLDSSRKVMDVTRRYEKELAAFGLIPDYYAYALVYWASRQSPDALRMAYEELPPGARDMFGPHDMN